MSEIRDPSSLNCCENMREGLRAHLSGRSQDASLHYQHALQGSHPTARDFIDWIEKGTAVELPLAGSEFANADSIDTILSELKSGSDRFSEAQYRGAVLASEFAAFFKPPYDHLWHAVRMYFDTKNVGANYAELRDSVSRVGPVHNVLEKNGVPIPNLIRERDSSEEAGWWDVQGVEFRGGQVNVLGAPSDPLPPLITPRDVDVALWLAFFEGPNPVSPSFSLDRAGDGKRHIRLDRKTFSPDWLAATEFGQSMYLADWLMKGFTMRDGVPSLTEPHMSGGAVQEWDVPFMLDKIGTTFGDHSLPDGRRTPHGRLEIVVRSVDLKKAVFRKWLKKVVQYEIKNVDVFVESSLYEYDGDGEANHRSRTHSRENDPTTQPGARAQLLTDNYSHANAMFPVFGRVAYLLGLYSTFCQARRDGVTVSGSEKRRIWKSVKRYKKALKQVFPAVEYSPKQFHKGGCYCSGGVSARVDANVVSSSNKPIEPAQEKVHVTYTKKHTISGEIYTGRSSGYGDPDEIVARRERSHHVNSHGLMTPARLDVFSTDADAIRGREEILIQRHGGPQTYGGSSGNWLSGISDENPKKRFYLLKAKEAFQT